MVSLRLGLESMGLFCIDGDAAREWAGAAWNLFWKFWKKDSSLRATVTSHVVMGKHFPPGPAVSHPLSLIKVIATSLLGLWCGVNQGLPSSWGLGWD